MSLRLSEFRRAGHWPTPLAAFLYSIAVSGAWRLTWAERPRFAAASQ